jgi:uncharacterized protein YjbI with pentapeptide repeats
MGLEEDSTILGANVRDAGRRYEDGALKDIPPNSDMSGMAFHNIQFLDVDFSDSKLRNTELSETMLVRTTLTNTDFTATEWSDVKVGGVTTSHFLHLKNGLFQEVKFVGNRMERKYLSLPHTLAKKARFEDCRFAYVELDDSEFARTELILCEFANTCLDGVSFVKSEMDAVEFLDSHGIRLTLYEAKLNGVTIRGRKDEKSSFQKTVAQNAHFNHCKFEYVDFSESVFDGATFSGPCIFRGCNLTGCSFDHVVVTEKVEGSKLVFQDCFRDGEPVNETRTPSQTKQPAEHRVPSTDEIIFESFEEIDEHERLFEENSDYILEELSDAE